MIFCYINVVNAGIKQFTWDIYVPLGVPGLRLDFENLLKRASPEFGGEGGGKNFFSDLEICMSRSVDMLRMAKPFALLGGRSGACPPKEFFLKWCKNIL